MRRLFSYAALALTLALGPPATAQPPVPDAANGIIPALIGSQIPGVEVLTLADETVRLDSFLAGQPTILVFFRGEW